MNASTLKHVLIVSIVILSLLFGRPFASRARADEPHVALGLAIAAGGLGFAVGKALGMAQSNSSTGLGELGGLPQDASVLVQDTSVASFVPGEPFGIQDINIPEDLDPRPAFRGFEQSGTFTRVPDQEMVSLELADGRFMGDLFEWQKGTGNDTLGFEVRFEGVEIFRRTAEDARFTFQIALAGHLATTDLMGTDAAASIFMNFNSPELGTLFKGSMGIRQGADASVLQGDFSGTPVTDTRGRVDFDFDSGVLALAVPREFDEFTINYEISVLGVAVPTDIVREGDTNGDGIVNIDDLNNVRNNFGAMGRADGTLDGDAFPFDGMVNIDDLNGVRNNFGAGAAAVPEPSSFALAVVTVLAVFCRRRDT